MSEIWIDYTPLLETYDTTIVNVYTYRKMVEVGLETYGLEHKPGPPTKDSNKYESDYVDSIYWSVIDDDSDVAFNTTEDTDAINSLISTIKTRVGQFLAIYFGHESMNYLFRRYQSDNVAVYEHVDDYLRRSWRPGLPEIPEVEIPY